MKKLIKNTIIGISNASEVIAYIIIPIGIIALLINIIIQCINSGGVVS